MKNSIPTHIPADFAKFERESLAALKRQLKEAIIAIEFNERADDTLLCGAVAMLENISPHLPLMLKACRNEQEIRNLRILLRLTH